MRANAYRSLTPAIVRESKNKRVLNTKPMCTYVYVRIHKGKELESKMKAGNHTMKTKLNWARLDCIGLVWTGLDWLGLDWIGINWMELD